MKLKPVKVPKIISKTLPGLVWEYPNENKTLYLTFDDGPTPGVTEWVLQTLDKYDAKATFFCVGKNVEKNPGIFNEIIRKGHSIGNHSYSHPKGWQTKTPLYLEDVSKADRIIKSGLFRPPYGQIKPKQIKALKKTGYQIIMWSVLSVDWDREISAESCLANVVDHANQGDIIVFHDSLKAESNMKVALEGTLKHFSERGYCFKRIPEPGQ